MTKKITGRHLVNVANATQTIVYKHLGLWNSEDDLKKRLLEISKKPSLLHDLHVDLKELDRCVDALLNTECV